MNANRKTATIVGVLFIIGTVVPIIGLSLASPIVNSPDYLAGMFANETQVLVGAFTEFIMAVACAGIGIALYPVLRRSNEGLALGAAGFRIMEGMFGIVGAIGLILLLALSREFVQAGAPNSSYFQTLGVLIIAGRDWVSNVAMLLTWCIGALMYYYVFYQTKLIPRWLAGWGLIGCTLTIIASLFIMFRVIHSFDTIQVVMNLPIAVQEMVMAVWLIVKGFNPSAVASRAAEVAVN